MNTENREERGGKKRKARSLFPILRKAKLLRSLPKGRVLISKA